jgi:DNA repair photolyase
MSSPSENTVPASAIHGRGAAENPRNRFVQLNVLRDSEAFDPEDPAPRTEFYRDSSKTIVATNDSPDVGFEASINPYRGCEHGCIYCFARPTHEYLGFSSGLDFETRIMVKENAPELLRAELASAKWEPKTLQLSGVTDCYQPIERRLKLTRRCLEVLSEFGNPVSVITKNHLVTRDIDLLSSLAERQAVVVLLSITTLVAELAAKMEPRASSPARRLEAVSALARAKVPVGVMVAPVVPGITDHEMPAILRGAADAGAMWAGTTNLRLPFALKELFSDWLQRHFPDRKEKVLNRIRSLRGGKLNQSEFGQRMKGEGAWAEQFSSMFKLSRRRVGLDRPFPSLSIEHFRRPKGPQMTLW